MILIYPFGAYHPLAEASTEPFIVPDQIITHSAADGPGPTNLKEYFDREDVKVESHFWINWEGWICQMMPLNRQADANLYANDRAISIETESNSIYSSLPWTPAQLSSLEDLHEWLINNLNIPRQIILNPDMPGIGYHSMYARGDKSDLSGVYQFKGNLTPNGKLWTKAYGKTCPGYDRVKQWETYLAPKLIQGDTIVMPTTKILRPGDRGEDVKLLQKAINIIMRRNPKWGPFLKLDEDGKFGPNTFDGVELLQDWVGANDDGIWGPETKQKTEEYINKVKNATLP